MSKREEAQEILQKLHACRPKSFFGKVDESQRGIRFILVYLKNSDHEVIAGELARELNVSTARIAALLKTMEKNGLIMRLSSETDARQTIVQITQAGIDYSEEMKERLLQKIELLLDKVGKEELEEFIRISDNIRKALGE